MTTQDRWRDPTAPMERLAEVLGFQHDKLQLYERPDELSYTDEKFDATKLALPEGDEKIKAEKLAALDEVLLSLREKYGAALTFQLSIGQQPVLTLDEEYERPKLDEFYKDIKRSPILILRLKIDKKELLSFWGFGHAKGILKMFLFPEALVRALSFPLTELEQDEDGLLKELSGEEKVVILVPKKGIQLDGEYLAVVGGDTLTKWKDYLPTKRPDKAKVKYINEQASKELKWVNFSLKNVTPLQLNVICKPEDRRTEAGPDKDYSIDLALYSQLLACSLLYMASHSRLNEVDEESNAQVGNLWVATFAVDRYIAKVEIGNINTLGKTLKTGSSENYWEAARTIADLAIWIYDGERGGADRLNVVQRVVANMLQDSDASINCRELIRQAPEISARVKGGWQSFMEEKLDKYFSQVKALEDTVETISKNYNEQVQALTKSLIDNMLAAVGVVVGSFIAAIFKSPFEAYVFRFGTGIYLAYLVVFPIGVGLYSTWQRFQDSKTNFNKRETDFSKRLTEETIAQIVGRAVSDRESWFQKWFWTTAALYTVVLVLVTVAIITVPDYIKKWGDNFELSGVSYGEPATSEVVPLIIRGENFDKDKEIVVAIGDSKFTTTDGRTLKVHGSTILTLSPQQKDLAAVMDKEKRFVTVVQGRAESKRIGLPDAIPSIPRPVFKRWNRVATRQDQVLEGYGVNFSSISEISHDGKQVSFKISDEGRKLELTDRDLLIGLRSGKALAVKLNNGEEIQVPVSVNK